MSHSAISIENLSKAYRIGLKEDVHDSLVGALQGLIQAPLKNWRRLSRLNTFVYQDDNAADMFWALRDVSFEVQEGAVVGIIGRNGAGKSTLLKILSRITEPTRGRATIRGRVSSLLEVGTGFHPELTGRENIYMNGTILGMTKREIDRKFDQIVDFSGVEKFLDTPVKRYSSGMRVRLAFSVAAHLEPEILIIDEVLAVGDSEFQKKCLEKMNEVSRSGRTVLFVSHNMGAIIDLCDKVVLLDTGRLTHYAATAEVIAKYARSCSRYNGSCVDLSCHQGRRNQGPPVFVGLRLLNDKGVATEQYYSGEPITIELIVDPHPDFDRLNFGITFDDHMGVTLFHVATHLSPTGPIKVCDRMRVHCSLNLPLAPAHYSITVQVGSSRTILDSVEQAVGFEVLPADFFGIGRSAKVNRGRFLVRSKWEAATV